MSLLIWLEYFSMCLRICGAFWNFQSLKLVLGFLFLSVKGEVSFQRGHRHSFRNYSFSKLYVRWTHWSWLLEILNRKRHDIVKRDWRGHSTIKQKNPQFLRSVDAEFCRSKDDFYGENLCRGVSGMWYKGTERRHLSMPLFTATNGSAVSDSSGWAFALKGFPNSILMIVVFYTSVVPFPLSWNLASAIEEELFWEQPCW